MNDDKSLHEFQMQRMMRAQTPLGRFSLGAYMVMRRFSWWLLVNGALLAKRALDTAIATVAIIMAAPLFILIALLVKSDGGPVFFYQTRVGLMGRPFRMIKFRSMCVDAEAKLKALLASNNKSQGVTFKMENDPRVTRVGRFIRKASIDELPQFFNVLKGEMSIVGPRPPLPREVALYTIEDRRRLLATPGITCLWQVGERNGGRWEVGDRNAIDFGEQVSLDVRYIESQSTLRDLWIMIKTLPAMLLGK